MSVTPDGRRAVSGSDDRTLRVWDLESGQCLRTLNGHSDGVWSVSVTPDGRRAVSGSEDKTVRVWDLESGQCLRTLERLEGHVTCVSVTPDGRGAVSASDDGALRVWDLESGQCLHTLEVHSNWIESMYRGLRVFSTSFGLQVWESWGIVRTLEGRSGGVWSVSVAPDGRRAVSASLDRTVQVWDLQSGRCLRTLEGHRAVILCVSVTPDGRRVVSGSGEGDKTMRVWDLETGECLAVAGLPVPISAVALSSVLGRMIVGTSTGEVLQFDVRGITFAAASQVT